MISQTTEYALRIIVYLASLRGEPATITQIAQASQMPPEYLPKILRNLAKGGLVVSQRGRTGGSVLARPPEEMTVWDVVNVVDPIERIRTCPLGLKNHGVSLCPLHRRLDDAIATVEAAFRGTTIAEVIADPAPSRPLQGIPTQPASGLVSARVLARKKSL